MSASLRPRLYSGPDAVRAMEEIRKTHTNQEQWPYQHVFPPVNSIPVNETGSIVTPAQGLSGNALNVILTYEVPEGSIFIMQGCVLGYINSGGLGAFVPGAALWTIDVNTAPNVTSVQNAPLQGLTNKTVPLGNFLTGNEWVFHRAYEFAPLDVIRCKGVNVALNVGDPNYFVAGIFGYRIPSVGNVK